MLPFKILNNFHVWEVKNKESFLGIYVMLEKKQLSVGEEIPEFLSSDYNKD